MALKAPFPYPGAKSRCAETVWQALGNVGTYIEPFFGSGAVLFARPHIPKIEIVNDKSAHITNVWRAIQKAPDEVARHAQGPIHEADLAARGRVIFGADSPLESLLTDPGCYDAKLAGWWIWGACCSIGHGWSVGAPGAALPQLFSVRGVLRQFSGVARHASEQLDHTTVDAWIKALSQRLANVRVASGDWSRVVAPAVAATYNLAEKYESWRTPIGIFLDPPYDGFEGSYTVETAVGVAQQVAMWAKENAQYKHVRIVLCGYDGDYDLPGWTIVPWKSKGGHDKTAKERLYLSPHCVQEARGKPTGSWGF